MPRAASAPHCPFCLIVAVVLRALHLSGWQQDNPNVVSFHTDHPHLTAHTYFLQGPSACYKEIGDCCMVFDEAEAVISTSKVRAPHLTFSSMPRISGWYIPA